MVATGALWRAFSLFSGCDVMSVALSSLFACLHRKCIDCLSLHANLDHTPSPLRAALVVAPPAAGPGASCATLRCDGRPALPCTGAKSSIEMAAA